MNKYVESVCDYIYEKQDFSIFNGKTILVTGANGLIGGMFSDFFCYLNDKKNYKINLILTSKSKKRKATRVKHLINKPNVKYYSCDITKKAIPITEKVDYCFYCAGYATPKKFINNSIENLNVNILGVSNTLSLVFNLNPETKFLYISSGEVYSANNNTKLYEETDTLSIEIANKRNSYKIGKIAGELLVNDFRNKGMQASSLRTTICYGPGVPEDDNRVLSDLVRKGLYSNTINLMDDGSSTRRFLHISDLCLVAFNIINKGKKKVYNLNGDKEYSILKIASLIGSILNKDVMLGEEKNDITNMSARSVSMSIDRYENEFGEHSFKSIEDGIKEFVEWYVKVVK